MGNSETTYKIPAYDKDVLKAYGSGYIKKEFYTEIPI